MKLVSKIGHVNCNRCLGSLVESGRIERALRPLFWGQILLMLMGIAFIAIGVRGDWRHGTIGVHCCLLESLACIIAVCGTVEAILGGGEAQEIVPRSRRNRENVGELKRGRRLPQYVLETTQR
jgi:hypothetical protein